MLKRLPNNADGQIAFLFFFFVSGFLLVLMSCTPSMTNAGDLPREASDNKVAKVIMATWQGDYPVDRLEALPEQADLPGTGYIDDAQTFSAVWSAFKPGEPEPDMDFHQNLVIFVRNIQYYNRISIGNIFLVNGEVEVIAMETLSAIPIEEKLAIAMAVISREGVEGIRARGGVLEVEGGR